MTSFNEKQICFALVVHSSSILPDETTPAGLLVRQMGVHGILHLLRYGYEVLLLSSHPSINLKFILYFLLILQYHWAVGWSSSILSQSFFFVVDLCLWTINFKWRIIRWWNSSLIPRPGRQYSKIIITTIMRGILLWCRQRLLMMMAIWTETPIRVEISEPRRIDLFLSHHINARNVCSNPSYSSLQ